MENINVCSWNTAGVRDKLHNPDIPRFLLTFHIIWLLETKTNAYINVPGFSVYSNNSKQGQHHGGIMMLVKSSWVRFVNKVDLVKMILFARVNVCWSLYSPDDSIYEYYSASHLGFLTAKVQDRKQVVVTRDFNAWVSEAHTLDISDGHLCYKGIKDMTVNGHGRRLIDVCNSVVVANHAPCR